MTTTVVLQVVDEIGAATWYQRDGHGRRHVARIEAHPAAAFDDEQPAHIEIRVGHDGPTIGVVDYLEHAVTSSDLTAVGVVDVTGEAVEGLYCSAELTASRPPGALITQRCRLVALAIVGATAGGAAAHPVRAFPGDYRNPNDRARWPWNATPSILGRAADDWVEQRRHPRRSLRIHRPGDFEHRVAAGLEPLGSPPPGALHYRPGGRILSVR